MLRYLIWLFRILLFLALLGFAVKNNEIVSLRFYFDTVWQAPLVLLLLIFFAVGTTVGLMAAMVTVFSQRREIGRLNRDLARVSPLATVRPVETSAAPRRVPNDIPDSV